MSARIGAIRALLSYDVIEVCTVEFERHNKSIIITYSTVPCVLVLVQILLMLSIKTIFH